MIRTIHDVYLDLRAAFRNKGIAESGTHDELMAKRGLYYELAT